MVPLQSCPIARPPGPPFTCRGGAAVHQPEQAAEVIIGVDTHKDTHTAVALDTLGTRLGTTTILVSREGYRQIEAWARSFGSVRAFGIECTGSYGAGLSRALQASGHRVLDVNRADRRARRRHGKNDPLDAEAAARAVLSGQATTLAKSGTSSVEMVRPSEARAGQRGEGAGSGHADAQSPNRQRPGRAARAAGGHPGQGDARPPPGGAAARADDLDHCVSKGRAPGHIPALAIAERGDRGTRPRLGPWQCWRDRLLGVPLPRPDRTIDRKLAAGCLTSWSIN